MPNRGRLPRRGGFSGRQRQPTTWSRSSAGIYVAIPANNKVLIALAVLSNPGIGETIRRTRGMFSVIFDQVAANETQVGAFGAIVVSDRAVVVGVSAIPDPVTEQNDDGWFVWEPFVQTCSVAQAVGVAVGQTQPPTAYPFDSKAMRKVQEGFQVAFMFANASSSHACQVALSFSMLTSLS